MDTNFLRNMITEEGDGEYPEIYLKITDPAYSFLVFQRILITPKD
jgi:hypothetical protein